MKKNTPRASSPLRVAAYCRIASSGEEQNAVLEAQKTYYTEQISTNPDWNMAGIFADTGDCQSKRPEFQKMLRKCRQRKIDLVLVKSISRLARNTADCIKIIGTLRELGVAVYFEKEQLNTLDPICYPFVSMISEFTKAECEHLTANSTHIHSISQTGSRTKRPQKKTIHPPGRPEKTMIARME